MTKPYISVVMVGRNDELLERINTFVRSLDHQVSRHPGLFELVVVEWNPEEGRAPLADVIRPAQHLPIRVITVPAQIHQDLGAQWPVLDLQARNVGIRRARGEYVLVTNPEILFSPALIDELARKKLRLDRVYRTDRYDFNGSGIAGVADSELVDFALRNTFVVHGMNGDQSISEQIYENERTWDLLPRTGAMPDSAYHTNGCGDFMLAAREVWFTVRGLYETTEHRSHVDSISLYRFNTAQVKQQLMTVPLCVFRQHREPDSPDLKFQDINVQELSRRPGSTSWGLRDHTLADVTMAAPAVAS